MSGDHDQGSDKQLAVQVGELTGVLRTFAGNQERINAQMAEATKQTASILASQGAKLAVCENNANCVPDLYEKHHKQGRQIAFYTGSLAVLIIIVQVAASFGPTILKYVTG